MSGLSTYRAMAGLGRDQRSECRYRKSAHTAAARKLSAIPTITASICRPINPFLFRQSHFNIVNVAEFHQPKLPANSQPALSCNSDSPRCNRAIALRLGKPPGCLRDVLVHPLSAEAFLALPVTGCPNYRMWLCCNTNTKFGIRFGRHTPLLCPTHPSLALGLSPNLLSLAKALTDPLSSKADWRRRHRSRSRL